MTASPPKPDMVYVASDPAHPESAFAICVDDDKYIVENSGYIRAWTKSGAIVTRRTREVGIDMLDKWIKARPKQKVLI